MSTTATTPRRPIRSLLTSAAVLVIAVVLALVGTGTSYALWNGRADVNGSSVSAGTTGLTVNGAQAFALTGMNTPLGPGQSVVTATPVTVANTGSTQLAVTVADTAVGGSTALADELTLTITPAATCSAGQAGGLAGRLRGYTTAQAPFTLAPAGQTGSTIQVCLQLTLDADAPTSVKGATTTFQLNLVGTQVR